mgnify:FL=1|jgi:hypothetical protein
MGIASLILGIISIILAFVPFIWMLSIVTAIVGLILGIISLVKKLEKGQSIAGIVLCAITLLLAIMSLYNIYNTFSDISTTTSTNIETGKQETTSNEDLKKNITVEALGITKNGDFAFKIINNNDQAVFVDTVNTVFKDANGNFMEKAQSQAQYFGIPANSEVVNYNWGYDKNFSNYPNYEFEIELSDSSWITDNMVLDNFEITANNTGKQIAVQVKNNNDVSFESINILIAYYQNGSIVGCENGYANTSTTAANGTAYINVDYPKDSKYKDVTFDDYKVYLLEANKSY